MPAGPCVRAAQRRPAPGSARGAARDALRGAGTKLHTQKRRRAALPGACSRRGHSSARVARCGSTQGHGVRPAACDELRSALLGALEEGRAHPASSPVATFGRDTCPRCTNRAGPPRPALPRLSPGADRLWPTATLLRGMQQHSVLRRHCRPRALTASVRAQRSPLRRDPFVIRQSFDNTIAACAPAFLLLISLSVSLPRTSSTAVTPARRRSASGWNASDAARYARRRRGSCGRGRSSQAADVHAGSSGTCGPRVPQALPAPPRAA